MRESLRPVMFWTPRVVGMLAVGFLALFAADAPAPDASFGTNAVAVTIHLIPAAIVFLAVAIASIWEMAGAVLLAALAIGAILLFGSHGRPAWVVAIPLIAVALLFLADAVAVHRHHTL